MKACEYCGRKGEDDALHCRECGTPFPITRPAEPEAVPARADAPPADLPPPRLVRPEEIAGAFTPDGGFHRADWDRVREWIHTNIIEPDREAAWDEAALLWVTLLRSDLGGNYFVMQSRSTILLSDCEWETARWLLGYAGRAAVTIREHLGDVAWQGAFGKDVVLVFSDQDDYYQYISHHCPEGEQAMSGGVCIHSGLTHIAIPWNDENDAANAIIHELTHDCLAHLTLPLWVNEGVAVTLQKAIAPPQRSRGESSRDMLFSAAINWRAPVMWDELAERHFAYWTPENIQSFWAGGSFHEPGEPNELSYSLAEVLMKLLSGRCDADGFRAFLQAADPADAGQDAALATIQVDLGELAGSFLGEGNWRPNRKQIALYWTARQADESK